MKLPVIVKFLDKDIEKLDLQRELRIDRTDLDRELARQAQLYNRWAELYAAVSARVAKLREVLEHLESRLFIQYTDATVTEKKHRINTNSFYRKRQKELRRWESAERHLKFAEKSFDQRASQLMCLSARQRKGERNIE